MSFKARHALLKGKISLMYVCERESAVEITQVQYYLLNRLTYTQNRVLLCFSQVEYSIFIAFIILCLIGVVKRGDRSGIRGWRGKGSFEQSLR